jgi:hypothetical protein
MRSFRATPSRTRCAGSSSARLVAPTWQTSGQAVFAGEKSARTNQIAHQHVGELVHQRRVSERSGRFQQTRQHGRAHRVVDDERGDVVVLLVASECLARVLPTSAPAAKYAPVLDAGRMS